MFTDKQAALNAFNSHHTRKSYGASKKISAEGFDLILELARLSPSSFGLESWRFLMIQNPGLHGEIRDISQGVSRVMNCSHFVILLVYTQQAMQAGYQCRAWGGVHHTPPKTIEITEEFSKDFSERDSATTENPRTFHDWACKQTYTALANTMTAVVLIGTDSMPVEGSQFDKVNSLLAEKGPMDPGEYRTSVMVAFGYHSRGPKRVKTRQAATGIIQWVEQIFDPLPAEGRLKPAPLFFKRPPNMQIQRLLGLCYIIPLPEPEKDTMYEINRSILLLIPFKPFWNWLQSLFGNHLDSLTLEDIQADASSYLVRPCETADKVWDKIETRFEDILAAELAGWCEDKREQPDLDTDIFDEWFDIQLSIVITDLEHEPLAHEAFRPINLN